MPKSPATNLNRVPILANNTPELYRRAKRAINKAPQPSILRAGGVGVLMANDSRIRAGKSFVMEYTAYLENGESVYFVPRGMSDPIKLQKFQILGYLAYPPGEVINEPVPGNVKWMEGWLDYAERRMARQSYARPHFANLIEEARQFVASGATWEEKADPLVDVPVEPQFEEVERMIQVPRPKPDIKQEPDWWSIFGF